MPAVRASTGSFDSLQINGCLAFVFLWLLSWLKIPKIILCLYVHFPKANHFPVEFVDFVFAVFCFTFRHGIHSPDYSRNILRIYGS